MRLWSPLVKVCTSRLSNLMQILAALTTDVRFGKFVYRGFFMSLTSIDLYETDGLLLLRSKSNIFQMLDL